MRSLGQSTVSVVGMQACAPPVKTAAIGGMPASIVEECKNEGSGQAGDQIGPHGAGLLHYDSYVT
jgi:hypothetical protein